MNKLEIIIIAISLAMDAFAVSICKGITLKKDYKAALIISFYFAIFQTLMPIIGYIFGSNMKYLSSIDHYIILFILSIIGINMILESKENKLLDDKINFNSMILLALATSIDALALGITFSFLDVDILSTILIIGIITFILSFIGVLIGSRLGNKFGSIAEFIGGVILILIGIHILLEHIS